MLLVTREVVQESLGFSPFELVFDYTVRGPLEVVEEGWLQDTRQYNLLDYVSELKYRFNKAFDLTHKNLKETQEKLKTWYDKKSRERVFNVGDRVLVLLPIPVEPLRAKVSGPYTIDKKVSDVDYIVITPDRRKTKRMYPVNWLQGYHVRDNTKPVLNQNTVTRDTCDENENPGDNFVMNCDGCDDTRLENADIMSNLETNAPRF